MAEEIIINNKCFIASQTDLKEYMDNMTDAFYCEVDKCDEVIKLKQENKDLKKQIESDKGLITVGGKQQYQYLQRIDELEQENKELSFAIEKCLENAGIECDDEEQALRSLPMLGNAHYKVLVEKEALKQENKEEKKAYNECMHYLACMTEQRNKLKTALEEIREIAEKYKDMEGCRIPLGAIKMTVDEVLNS